MAAFDPLTYIHQRSWKESGLGLHRLQELLEKMGNPHKKLQYVHVAGTNGKGSVCAMTESILSEAGLKTGLFISPYIHHFNERIQVNQRPISHQALGQLTAYVREFADQMAEMPTEFELTAAIAFAYFLQQQCDVVVLEVGLGGRLDATNIIPPPLVAAVTAIGLDHTDVLGETAGEIAGEKAGIIKQGCDVVLYPQTEECRAVIKAACQKNNARLYEVDPAQITVKENNTKGQLFDYGKYKNLKLPLLGIHQIYNAATAISVIQCLRQHFRISDDQLYNGLRKTKWPGRFEILSRQPDFVVDGGHNPQCIEAAAQALRFYFPKKKIVLLAGVMADKSVSQMFLPLIPLTAQVVTITPDNSRALDALKLAALLKDAGFLAAQPCSTIKEGIQTAQKLAGPDGCVCALGSLYMVGAIRSYFGMDNTF